MPNAKWFGQFYSYFFAYNSLQFFIGQLLEQNRVDKNVSGNIEILGVRQCQFIEMLVHLIAIDDHIVAIQLRRNDNLETLGRFHRKRRALSITEGRDIVLAHQRMDFALVEANNKTCGDHIIRWPPRAGLDSNFNVLHIIGKSTAHNNLLLQLQSTSDASQIWRGLEKRVRT